jgi:hypothetical protein
MVGTRVDYGFDRGRISRGSRIGGITLDLCQRQIVVFFAKQHQHWRPGIRAAFGNHAKVSAGIAGDVRGTETGRPLPSSHHCVTSGLPHPLCSKAP